MRSVLSAWWKCMRHFPLREWEWREGGRRSGDGSESGTEPSLRDRVTVLQTRNGRNKWGHYKYYHSVNVALCGEFFAVGKIKDFVNSSEAGFKWVSSSRSCYCNYAENEILLQMPTIFGFPLSLSVKILDHTTECILLETNSQRRKNSAECTQETGSPGLAAFWRQLGGTGQVETCRGLLDTLHCGKRTSSNCLILFCFEFSFYLRIWCLF